MSLSELNIFLIAMSITIANDNIIMMTIVSVISLNKVHKIALPTLPRLFCKSFWHVGEANMALVFWKKGDCSKTKNKTYEIISTDTMPTLISK